MKKPIILPTGIVLLPYSHDDGFCRIDLKLGPQAAEQIFTFKGDDGSVFHFDIPKIKNMIAANPTAYETGSYAIRPEDVHYVLLNRGVEEDHLTKLAETNLDENGLIVRFPDNTVVTIDGNHRMIARYRRQYDFMDFTILTIEQARPALLALPDDFGAL